MTVTLAYFVRQRVVHSAMERTAWLVHHAIHL